MKKRRFIAFVSVVICLVIGISVIIRRSQETISHRGQTLKAWSIQASQGDSNAVAILKELGTNSIPELIQLLKTKDSFFRKQTWTHLPRLPVWLRQNIARSFPPPQAELVRESAARALGRLGPDAKIAIPALSLALRDNQGRVRWDAATALSLSGKDAVPALIKALEEKDARARHATAYALGQMGPDAGAAVPALVRKLSDQDYAVRNSAAYSLTVIGIPGVLALVDAAEKGQAPARAVAASMLTNSSLPLLRVSSELLKMAKNESPAARKQAIETLRAIRVARGPAIHASLSALDDPVLEVRLAAIETLGTRGGQDETVIRMLAASLSDGSPRIREAAANALGNIGTDARAAVPELTRLTKEEDKSVSEAAKIAMGKIGQNNPDNTATPQR